MQRNPALFRFRLALSFFVFGLVTSGVTAFPLLTEVRWLNAAIFGGHGSLSVWLWTVQSGLQETYAKYPWIGYGTDWLAFGHLMIALFFVGAFADPAGSRSVLLAGLAACVLVVPTAFICGAVRGIPVTWRLIDCSFGILGLLPLAYCLRLLREIPRLAAQPE